MFINTREIDKNSFIHCNICIIGAGMAGITLAVELSKKGIDTCLVESGGDREDFTTNELYDGESTGIPHIFSNLARSRYLGGSSNCWHGWCAPLDEHDFKIRNWVNESGWPFGKEELTPYYKKAHSVLKLGSYNYSPAYWEKAINHREVTRIITDPLKVIDKISQFSPPARMGSLYKDDLNAANIKVFLHGNITSIDCNNGSNQISGVKVKTLNGNSFYISSRLFILATGGIENARLLLSSDDTHKKGIGNINDLVGKYFMDHPRVFTGNIIFKKPWKKNRLYNLRYHDHSSIVSAQNTCIASQLAIPSQLQEKEGLLNARVSFFSTFLGEESKAADALRMYKKAFTRNDWEGFYAGRESLEILKDPIGAISFCMSKYFKPRFLVNNVNYQIIIEQEPNPQSRITLSNEKDALGMRRVKVNWQTGEKEKYTIDRTLEIISGELQRASVAEKIVLDEKLEGKEWPSKMQGTWHHMGTTRMNDSPRKGVVDRNCKVHGIENLYIAGSSVFPTGGANFPTITLTALAIRLADHIANKLIMDNKKINLTGSPVIRIENEKTNP